MLKLTVDLPTKRRLNLSLVKRRGGSQDKPLVPDLDLIKKTRKGNKISRFFRHIFEHKKIKRVLGTNLAILLIFGSLTPAAPSLEGEEDIIISQNYPPLTTKTAIRYPIEEEKVTQGYKFFHPGVDFEGTTGDPVYPIMAGVVEDISSSSVGYGKAVIVNHGSEITSLYAHLSKIEVEKKQTVSTDTKIGEVGSSGSSTGDHLHLEIREAGYPINPYLVLPH